MSESDTSVGKLLTAKGILTPLHELAEAAGLSVERVRELVIECYLEELDREN